MNYLNWSQKTLTDGSSEDISKMYNNGYVYTRLGKGVMDQTRSVRIDLGKFQLSSENRRIQKKISGLELHSLPLPLQEYDWKLGKAAKDFYDTKFGSGIMSAQKIKEILTSPDKSNFNTLFIYRFSGRDIGHAVCYQNDSLLHYSYPFYDISSAPKDMGLGMMLLAIDHAKQIGLKYIYLGSLQRPGDTYKLQFEGLEWFDGNTWQNDISLAKDILAK
ncbi:MAG: hypothetical protein WCV79_02140 [Candidatus Paceibacterota bacterium]|jgi:arginyl-tRNA--protein-N-Asp/Glu arginylyltransferase